MNGLLIVIAAVAAIILLLIVTNIRIVPQSRAWVMERIGVYSKTWHTGLHIKFPIIERAAKKVDLREQILVCGEGFNHAQYHNHNHTHKHDRICYEYGQEESMNGNGALGSKANNRANQSALRDGNASVAVGIPNTPVNVSTSVSAKGARASQLARSDGQIVGFVNANSTDARSGFENRVSHSYNGNVHNRHSQPVITKDNVSMEMDTVVFYQITDPKLFVYGHANPLKAIEHLVATSLRNIVGGLELDETLTSRELINSKIRVVLDEVTDAWGIKITRVELKNIIISDVELAEAMEKQMIAERTKRAQILLAEGESQSKILEAEGLKKYDILIAEGKAEAIRLVNEAKPSQEFLNIRALEAYEKAAHGQATKIIVPSNLQSLAGLALSGSEVFKEGEKMGE